MPFARTSIGVDSIHRVWTLDGGAKQQGQPSINRHRDSHESAQMKGGLALSAMLRADRFWCSACIERTIDGAKNANFFGADDECAYVS